MKCAAALLSLLVTTTMLLPGCSLRKRTVPARSDRSGKELASDARVELDSAPDFQIRPAQALDSRPTSKVEEAFSGPACPAPCPTDHDCVAVFPNTTAGLCLKRCGSGCGPCGGGPGWEICSQCQVEISGIKYCMDFCRWKGSTLPCPDPAAQVCVDAYSIPNNLLAPGYEGAGVCVSN